MTILPHSLLTKSRGCGKTPSTIRWKGFTYLNVHLIIGIEACRTAEGFAFVLSRSTATNTFDSETKSKVR